MRGRASKGLTNPDGGRPGVSRDWLTHTDFHRSWLETCHEEGSGHGWLCRLSPELVQTARAA